MTTPTREHECKHERIKTWVFEDTKEPAMWSCADCGLKFAPEMATLTAGREQGLSEAYDIALRAPFKQPELDADEWESPEAAHDAGLKSMAFDITAEIRAAIEQLRAPRAT